MQMLSTPPEQDKIAHKPCILCGPNAKSKTLVELHGNEPLVVLQCMGCGLVYTDEHLSEKDLIALYAALGDIYDSYSTFNYDEDFATKDKIDALQLILSNVSSGRCVDIGCARGTLLNWLREQGWDCYGVDISAETVARGRTDFGLNLYAGTLEQAHYPDASFSLVTAFDVIEHLQDPLVTLQDAHRILEPNGSLIMEVPNESTVFRIIGRMLYRTSFKRIEWPLRKLYYIFHMYYFSPETILRLFDKAGFRLERIVLKEAYQTRHGLHNHSYVRCAAIRGLVAVDKAFGLGAKLLVHARKI